MTASEMVIRASERDAIFCIALPDDRVVDVVPLLGGLAKIAVTRPEDFGLGVYDEVWHYESAGAALRAAFAWDGEGEPTGWHRHLATGRRRPGGHAAQEYVRE